MNHIISQSQFHFFPSLPSLKKAQTFPGCSASAVSFWSYVLLGLFALCHVATKSKAECLEIFLLAFWSQHVLSQDKTKNYMQGNTILLVNSIWLNWILIRQNYRNLVIFFGNYTKIHPCMLFSSLFMHLPFIGRFSNWLLVCTFR